MSKDNDSQRLSNLISFLKKNGRTLIELASLIGIIAALLQLNLQQRQFSYEQQNRPRLDYSYNLEYSLEEVEAISLAAQSVSEKYYDQIYKKKMANPASTYNEIINSTLPITETLPAKPFFLAIEIKNKGQGTANRVRIFLELDRSISSIDIASIEPSSIIEGGIGNNYAKLEIDRIVANDSVTVRISSIGVSDEAQLDKIVYKKSNLLIQRFDKVTFETSDNSSVPFIYDNQGKLVFISGSAPNLIYYSFPDVIYIPAQDPKIRITITSDEGPVPTNTPSN